MQEIALARPNLHRLGRDVPPAWCYGVRVNKVEAEIGVPLRLLELHRGQFNANPKFSPELRFSSSGIELAELEAAHPPRGAR